MAVFLYLFYLCSVWVELILYFIVVKNLFTPKVFCVLWEHRFQGLSQFLFCEWCIPCQAIGSLWDKSQLLIRWQEDLETNACKFAKFKERPKRVSFLWSSLCWLSDKICQLNSLARVLMKNTWAREITSWKAKSSLARRLKSSKTRFLITAQVQFALNLS